MDIAAAIIASSGGKVFSSASAMGSMPRQPTANNVSPIAVNTKSVWLSGTLVGGQMIANRAQVVDAKVGNGHVVMFGIRPFWRWQTHGTYFLGFNTILNWNDLGAGRDVPAGRPASLQP